MRLSNHCTRPSQSIYTCHVYTYVHPMHAVGGLSSTGKSFSVVRSCAQCVRLWALAFPFPLWPRQVFPFPFPRPPISYIQLYWFSRYIMYMYIAAFGGLLHGIGPSRNCLLGSGTELAAGFFLEEFVNPRSPKWSMA